MSNFVNKGDVQTLAMLSCVFREPFYHELNKAIVSQYVITALVLYLD